MTDTEELPQLTGLELLELALTVADVRRSYKHLFQPILHPLPNGEEETAEQLVKGRISLMTTLAFRNHEGVEVDGAVVLMRHWQEAGLPAPGKMTHDQWPAALAPTSAALDELNFTRGLTLEEVKTRYQALPSDIQFAIMASGKFDNAWIDEPESKERTLLLVATEISHGEQVLAKRMKALDDYKALNRVPLPAEPTRKKVRSFVTLVQAVDAGIITEGLAFLDGQTPDERFGILHKALGNTRKADQKKKPIVSIGKTAADWLEVARPTSADKVVADPAIYALCVAGAEWLKNPEKNDIP